MRVLQAFSRTRSELTLTEIALATALVPATARRALHTLERLGYVGQRGRLFLLRPKVLSFGTAYLSGINTRDALEPFLWDIVDAVRGSASIAVLDDLDVVYLAHASACRALRLSANGVQVPAYTTAIGCVLLAFQPNAVRESYFDRARTNALVQGSGTDLMALRRRLQQIKEAGFDTGRHERGRGVVLAVPVFSPSGRVVAAMSYADTVRLTDRTMLSKHLPVLRQAASGITEMLGRYPELVRSIQDETVGEMSESSAPPATGLNRSIVRSLSEAPPKADASM
jgi:IclR family pca regulon transcriptional regulator